MNYEKFSFPDYVYNEFPKWIDTVDGKVVVHSMDEELATLDTVVADDSDRIKRPYKRKDI